MAKAVCAEHGCATLIPAGQSRCSRHARVVDAARGTRQHRGYGKSFDAAKRGSKYRNATHCTNCGETFTPGNPKTAGHIKSIRDNGPNDEGITPQCRRCNYGWRKTGT